MALGRSQAHLIWFIPWAWLATGWFLFRKSIDRLVCGDALIFAVLRPVLSRRVKVAVMVMGLDLIYPKRWYRVFLQWALRRADRVIAISRATADQAVRLGVPESRIAVVNPGVKARALSEGARIESRLDILGRLGLDEGSFLILSLGRLIPRKGVRWFVEAVMPRLPEEAVCLVAGTGPEAQGIRRAAERAGVVRRLRMLGLIDSRTKDLLLTGADVVVVPNVPVPGDMEGFGLVAVEAALGGTPVVASRLEGLQDAVVDGVTGYLCEPLDPESFETRIRVLMSDRERDAERALLVRAEAEQRFSLERMAEELFRALET